MLCACKCFRYYKKIALKKEYLEKIENRVGLDWGCFSALSDRL